MESRKSTTIFIFIVCFIIAVMISVTGLYIHYSNALGIISSEEKGNTSKPESSSSTQKKDASQETKVKVRENEADKVESSDKAVAPEGSNAGIPADEPNLNASEQSSLELAVDKLIALTDPEE